MTQNQIAFYRAQEERRHNVRTEGQTDVSLNEMGRHNRETEAVNWYSAKTGAAVGFAQATAANKQANAALQQAHTQALKVGYDYELGQAANLIQSRRATNDYMLGLKNYEIEKKRKEDQTAIDWSRANTEQAKLEETKRHNKKMETFSGALTGSQFAGNLSGIVGSLVK